MAKQVLGPASKVTFNGTDLSQYVTTGSITDSRDDVDVTGFSETYREYLPGIGDATATITFVNDLASGGPDATIYPSYSTSTAGTLKVTPNTAGTVTYTLICKPYDWTPMDGGVGDANTIQVTFRNAGTAGLSRGTA